jgi:hypothetical protein
VLKTIPWRRVDIKVRDDAVPDKIQESSYCWLRYKLDFEMVNKITFLWV